MAIRKCLYCGKPFNSVGTDLCAECSEMIDDAYQKARKYFYQNPDRSSYASVLENTEISEKALNYLIDNNMLEIKKPTGGARCRICGAATSGGSLCNSCMRKILSPSSGHPNDRPDLKKESVHDEKAQSLPLQSRRN